MTWHRQTSGSTEVHCPVMLQHQRSGVSTQPVVGSPSLLQAWLERPEQLPHGLVVSLQRPSPPSSRRLASHTMPEPVQGNLFSQTPRGVGSSGYPARTERKMSSCLAFTVPNAGCRHGRDPKRAAPSRIRILAVLTARAHNAFERFTLLLLGRLGRSCRRVQRLTTQNMGRWKYIRAALR